MSMPPSRFNTDAPVLSLVPRQPPMSLKAIRAALAAKKAKEKRDAAAAAKEEVIPPGAKPFREGGCCLYPKFLADVLALALGATAEPTSAPLPSSSHHVAASFRLFPCSPFVLVRCASSSFFSRRAQWRVVEGTQPSASKEATRKSRPGRSCQGGSIHTSGGGDDHRRCAHSNQTDKVESQNGAARGKFGWDAETSRNPFLSNATILLRCLSILRHVFCSSQSEKAGLSLRLDILSRYVTPKSTWSGDESRKEAPDGGAT